jgi:hypothetical protein
MAISLKKYDRQVGVSAQTGTQAIGGGLASAMIQEAGAKDKMIASSLGMFQEVTDEIFERNQLLKEKKEQAERNLLKLELDSKKRIADSFYQTSKDGRTDYNVWGTSEDTELNDLQKEYQQIAQDPRLQQYPDLQAEYNITLNSGIKENIGIAQLEGLSNLTKQTQAVNEVEYKELIEKGDIVGANALLDTWDQMNLFSIEDVAERRVQLPRQIEESSIDKLVASNPLEFIKLADEQIDGKKTHYKNVDIDYLRSKKATAKATWNSDASLITNDLWGRAYDAKRSGDMSAMEAVKTEALLYQNSDQIVAKEGQALYEFTSNPYGDSKTFVPLEVQSNLYNQAAMYNPNKDLDNSSYLKISNEIAHIENATIRTQLKNVLDDSKEGNLQGVAFSNIMDIIDADAKRDIFGDSVISVEMAVFAKQKVVDYLRENPNNFNGAYDLYQTTKKPQATETAKNVFRKMFSDSLDNNAALETLEEANK